MIKKIIYLTQTRPDYSLNSVLIKGLKENGVEIAQSHVKDKGILGFIKTISFYRQNLKNTEAIIIGYDSPALASFIRLFCTKKIVYNAVLSVYERFIIARELAPRLSIKAVYYWLLDFLAVHFSNLTMVESDHQARFFQQLFKVSGKKIYRSWIGANEDQFFYGPSVFKLPIFTVVFRGALMPEAGAEYLIQAAKILERENIKFIMISGGLLLDKTNKLIKELKPKNLEFRSELLPIEELRVLMQKSDLSIGQLSDHPRLKRTIPHKLYESLAMCLPYLTASNDGVSELLTAGETCIICRPADAQSVAEKIVWAKNNPQELEKIAQNGYQLYQDKLRSNLLAKNLLDKIEKL